MKYETWDNILKHLFVLCGIRKMDQAEHALYITDMFAELKDRFTDDEISVAARQIAETENLYGAYPSLATWLKYSPEKRKQEREKNKYVSYIREYLQDIVNMDSMYFDAEYMEEVFIKKFPDIGKLVLEDFGGVSGLRNILFNSASQTQDKICNEFINAFEKLKTDALINTPRLRKEQTLSIEEKE